MAVVGAPEELHPVEQDAVNLLVVEPCAPQRNAIEEVAPDEAIGPVDAQNDVLGVAAGLRGRPRAFVVGASVEDHVLGLGACALDLEVAAHAGAELLRRDTLAVLRAAALAGRPPPLAPARRSGSDRWDR